MEKFVFITDTDEQKKQIKAFDKKFNDVGCNDFDCTKDFSLVKVTNIKQIKLP